MQRQKAYKDSVEQSPRVLDQEASLSNLFSPDVQAVTQRKLKSTSADVVPTPAEAVKRATGVVVGNQLLPGGQPANSVPRPRKVEAEVDSGTLRKDERAKDGILSKVTAMARAEQRILQGTDMQKFYDAGHLVGDQLVGRKIDSFEYWNLAPQISSFNTPAYSGVEGEIRTLAEAKGATVAMEVDLGYPNDYSVPVGHLKKRGIVPSTVQAPDTKAVQIHRRIPNKWGLRAHVVGKTGVAQTPTVSGPAALTSPTLGQAFKMAHARALEQTGGAMGHEVSGEQWAPSEEIQSGDILSILAKTFEDLGSADDIAARILTPDKQIVPQAAIALIKQAAGEVALSLMELANSFSSMKDASVMQEYLALSKGPIEQLIIEAQQQTDLRHAANYLISAKGWVEAIREKSEELSTGTKRTVLFNAHARARNAF